MSSVTSGLSSIPPGFNTPLEPQQVSEDTATGSLTQPDEYVDYCALRLEAALGDGPSAIQWWCEPRQRARFTKLCKTAVEVLLSIPAMSAEPDRAAVFRMQEDHYIGLPFNAGRYSSGSH